MTVNDRLELWQLAAGEDEEVAQQAVEDLIERYYQQGVVRADAASAVPRLLDLVAVARHHRSWLVSLIGIMASPDHADPGEEQSEVLEAIRRDRDRFVSLLQDHDAAVRAAAAYTLGRVADVAALLDRWAVEDEPNVRAAIVLGLGDPLAAPSCVVTEESPVVRVAAAIAIARSGRRLPDGCAEAIERAYAEDPGLALPFPLTRHGEVVLALVGPAAADDAVEVIRRLLGARAGEVRQQAIWAIGERCERYRSAPARLVPILADVLHDEDPQVRLSAVMMAWKAGRSARVHADALAAIAGQYPAQVSSFRVTAAGFAIRALARLGDPRWLEPVVQALLAGRDVSSLDLHPGDHPHSLSVLEAADALRQRHADDDAVAQWLANYIAGRKHARHVQPSAEDDVNVLLAQVEPAGGPAALAKLVQLRATHVLPQLRRMVDQETRLTGMIIPVGQVLWSDEQLVDKIRETIAVLEDFADQAAHQS